MTSRDIGEDLPSEAINGLNHDNSSCRDKWTRSTKSDNEIDTEYTSNAFRTREISFGCDNKSEGSPLLDDLNVTFRIKGKNKKTGSTQPEVSWQNGVRSAGLLTSSGVWPMAEGSLRQTSRDIESSVESSFSNQSKNGTEESFKKERTKGPEALKDENEEEDEDSSKFSFRKLSKDQKIILVSTSVTNLLSFLSLSILAPFFPLEADKKNVDGTVSGWIFGVFALVQFLTSPLFGRMLPIVGSKFMYISGIFVTCICTFLFGLLDLVPYENGVGLYITLCFLVRIMLALGCTAISNSGFVMLVKAFPDNVATVFSIGEVFTGVGMVTGPAMGGFLYTAGGFVLPFLVIGGCCLVALPVIWFTLPHQDDSVAEENNDLSIRKLVLCPRSIVNSIVIIVAASIWSILDPTLEPHLRVLVPIIWFPLGFVIIGFFALDGALIIALYWSTVMRLYGFGPELVGLLFLIMAACYSVTSPIWGTLSDAMPDNRTLLIPGFVVAAAGLLLIGPSPALGFDLSYNELWLTIVSLVILGVASSLVVIPTYDIYIEVLSDIGYPEDTRTYGMVSGLWVSMYALGDFIGPSAGGFLNDEIGFEWMTTGLAVICLATSMLVGVSWLVEAKCCNKKKSLDGVEPPARVPIPPTERTPLLISTSTDLGSVDLLKTYPPYKENN